jgi:hypothetical protein
MSSTTRARINTNSRLDVTALCVFQIIETISINLYKFEFNNNDNKLGFVLVVVVVLGQNKKE